MFSLKMLLVICYTCLFLFFFFSSFFLLSSYLCAQSNYLFFFLSFFLFCVDFRVAPETKNENHLFRVFRSPVFVFILYDEEKKKTKFKKDTYNWWDLVKVTVRWRSVERAEQQAENKFNLMFLMCSLFYKPATFISFPVNVEIEWNIDIII